MIARLPDYPEEEVERKKAHMNHLRELFEAIDVSAEGTISRESLVHAFKHEAIVACQKDAQANFEVGGIPNMYTPEI